MPSSVTIVGATGDLGFGLALRLARAGVAVTIGSRDAGRAAEAAERVAAAVPGAQVSGLRESGGGRGQRPRRPQRPVRDAGGDAQIR